MAEQVTSHVVNEAQSMARPASIDDTASTTSSRAVNGELPSGSASSATVTPATAVQTSTLSPKAALSNGDSGDLSATESSAIADASGGSDTDISRPGSVDQSKREPSHVRSGSNAVKKPSTFKSVSVTKNFLAKSASSTPVPRPGDKSASPVPASATATLAAKPRLVAKLATGNTPRALGQSNGVGAGPDASKVWNKNQPVPPAPPKQFTDEELKQQYGIHLATRLQADESGKEAKWADIDDDEDDWAPEAVQWMDGTKSSGTALEPEPATVEEPKATTIVKEAPQESSTPAPVTKIEPPKSSVSGGIKTILKPGAHLQPSTGKSSLVLKGQPEKPTLVSKTSTSEKKSPWATLPPVEKVSPIQIKPQPQQVLQNRMAQRDSFGYDAISSMPAKEIAPDDFNRSWRDDRGGRPELFNSQSGRYEPVNEMRRGSNRDSGFKQQPALLQRPSHDGPAEPSAAFQTSRSSGDMPTWGRRRNSSNVSASNPRRMSFDRRPPEMPNGPGVMERRSSHSINGADPSDQSTTKLLPNVAVASPSVSHAHPVSPLGSVASSSIQENPAPVAAIPTEDPVEVQKRLMADKIERARLKKQQEQEAEKREEAERKERLAKRLAAMGPPVEKAKTREASPARGADRSPQKSKATPTSTQSPPKPPVPTSEGEVAQYGMMKVHQAQPLKKASPTDPASISDPASPDNTMGQPSNKSQPENEAKASATVSQAPATFDPFSRNSEKIKQSREQPNSSPQQAESAISSSNRSNASQPNWQSSAPHPRPWTSQVWGPPQAKDRALGNGTFGSSYDRSQARGTAQPQLPPQAQAPVTPVVNLNLAPKSSITSSVAPGSYAQGNGQNTGVAPPVAPLSEKGWGNFATHIAQDDRNMVAKARQDLERLGGDSFRPEIRETYKDQRGQTQTTLHDKIPGHPSSQQGTLKKDEGAKMVHDGPRASRFFPRSSEPPNQQAVVVSAKLESPPPPPETESHPVFGGHIDHPLVRLPKPAPVVRLPPAIAGNASQSDAPVSMPARGNPGLGARPLAMNPEWQARFNRLLEKPNGNNGAVDPGAHNLPASVPRSSLVAPAMNLIAKPGSLPVAASSKASLDVRGGQGPATVSLPNALPRRTHVHDNGREFITRNGTESLFEDREFGSLPTVRLPKVAHLGAREASVQPAADDLLLIRFKRLENPFTTRRLEVFDLEKGAQKIDVIIRLSHMKTPMIRSMQRRSRFAKHSQYLKAKRNGASNAAPGTGLKDRPRKPSQQGQADRASTAQSATSNTWSSGNHAPSAQQAPTTWARLAAAPVH